MQLLEGQGEIREIGRDKKEMEGKKSPPRGMIITTPSLFSLGFGAHMHAHTPSVSFKLLNPGFELQWSVLDSSNVIITPLFLLKAKERNFKGEGVGQECLRS